MTDPAEQAEADRWDREAAEELLAAEVIAEHPEVPNRVAGFHAHLAAEKALKALLIRRNIVVPRIHDLIERAPSSHPPTPPAPHPTTWSCSTRGPSKVATPPTCPTIRQSP